MKHIIAAEIYKSKYENHFTYRQFLFYLQRGLSLLKNPQQEMQYEDAKAMDIALQYNIQRIIGSQLLMGEAC